MDTSASSDTASGSVAGIPLAAARRILGMVVGTVITVVFLAVWVAAPQLHIGFSPVLTGSMRPAFAPGDLLITAPQAVAGLQTGQVAVFTPPGETVPYAHRITALGGYSYQYASNEGFNAFNSDFPSDLYTYNRIESGDDEVRSRTSLSSRRARSRSGPGLRPVRTRR